MGRVGGKRRPVGALRRPKKKGGAKRHKKGAKRRKPQGPFLCYILHNICCNKVYTGQTNNWSRRIRQHNGEIKGGARYTTRNGKGCWRPMFHILGFQLLKHALQFEYSLKKRGPRVRGPSGRVRKLEYVLAKCSYPPNIKVHCFISKTQYLKWAKLDAATFDTHRKKQGVEFCFLPKGPLSK